MRRRLQEGSLNLPVAHPVLRDVTRIMGNPLRRGTRFLQGIVERDQELALRILHRANAEPFREMGPVQSLRLAVDRLGRHAVFAVAIKSVTERMESGPSDRRRGRLSLQLWRRTIATATAARILAGAAGAPEPERLYTLALLMDIGEPLLLGVIEDVVQELPIAPPYSQIRREVASKHPEFGAALLEGWGLPNDVIEVARRHHDPAYLKAGSSASGATSSAAIPSEAIASDLYLVTAARYAAAACEIGPEAAPNPDPPSQVDPHPTDLDPYPADLDRCLKHCALDDSHWQACLDTLAQSIEKAGLSSTGRTLTNLPAFSPALPD